MPAEGLSFRLSGLDDLLYLSLAGLGEEAKGGYRYSLVGSIAIIKCLLYWYQISLLYRFHQMDASYYYAYRNGRESITTLYHPTKNRGSNRMLVLMQ